MEDKCDECFFNKLIVYVWVNCVIDQLSEKWRKHLLEVKDTTRVDTLFEI